MGLRTASDPVQRPVAICVRTISSRSLMKLSPSPCAKRYLPAVLGKNKQTKMSAQVLVRHLPLEHAGATGGFIGILLYLIISTIEASQRFDTSILRFARFLFSC